VASLLTLRGLPIDTQDILDVSTDACGVLRDVVLPQFAHYGDIALLRRGDRLDVFVSGVSEVAPFVARLRFAADQLVSAKVLVASRPVFDLNTPRGVAVTPRARC
jgi:hypothetical protein